MNIKDLSFEQNNVYFTFITMVETRKLFIKNTFVNVYNYIIRTYDQKRTISPLKNPLRDLNIPYFFALYLLANFAYIYR